MKKLVFLLFISLFISYETVNGQSSEKHKWYVNGSAGIAQAYGDVQDHNNPVGKFKGETDIAYGIRLAKYVSPVYAVHLQYIMGQMRGQRLRRDFTFSNHFQNIQLGATANLSSIIFGEDPERKFVIYGLTGLSLSLYQTDVSSLTTGAGLDESGKPVGEDKIKKGTALGFPIGVGLAYNLSNNFSINMGTTLNLLDNDRLDGIVSGKRNDAFYYTSLGLSYNFLPKPEPVEQQPPVPEETIALDTTGINVPDDAINLRYVFPEKIYSGEDFEFQCVINKSNLTGKAELMQILPIGFHLNDTVFDGADRSEFQNYILKAYWDNMSEDSIITINYHAHLDDIFGYLPVTSVLYIDKTGKEYTFDTNIFIEKEHPEEIAGTEQNNEKEPAEEMVATEENGGVENTEVSPPGSLVDKTSTQNEEETIIANEEETVTANEAETTISNEENQPLTDANVSEVEIDTTGIQEAESTTQNEEETGNIAAETSTGVSGEDETIQENDNYDTSKAAESYSAPGEIEYRVQIRAAYKAQCSLSALAKKYDLSDPIKEDHIGNWYRYSVGSFSTLTEAKEYRKSIIRQHGVIDAFVVAYKDGERLNSISELKELKGANSYKPNTTYSESGRVYRVQIMALLHHRIEPADLQSMYSLDQEVSEETYGQWRKYVVGNTNSLEEAKSLVKQMKDHGISDAFIVIYDNGRRLNVFGI